MPTAASSLIVEIVALSETLDALAQADDWLAMRELAARRLHCLQQAFHELTKEEAHELTASEYTQLSNIVESNQQLLDNACARRHEIIVTAETHRTGAAANRAYTAYAR